MVLSVRHNFLFVHIAKTAGTSVRASLRRLQRRDPLYVLQFLCSRISHATGHRLACKLPRHARVIAAKEMLPVEFFDGLFKFSFVRNPWDRYVSAFHHIKRERAHFLAGGAETFEGFLDRAFDPHRPFNYHFDMFSAVQRDYLIDLQGNICVDFIGRFENLEADYLEIFRRIGAKPPSLGHKRQETKRKDFREYYTDHTAELVARRHAADLKEFGYTFDGR